MREHFDATMSANMITMMRADVDGAIWIIDDEEEGRFYERAAHERGRVVPAFGGASAVLRIIDARGVAGVVGVTHRAVDDGAPLPLYRPDVGDVASLLLLTRAADRVLGEVGGAAWLTACGRDLGGILPWAIRTARVLHAVGAAPLTEASLTDSVDWSIPEIRWDRLNAEGSQIAAARRIATTDAPEVALRDCQGITVIQVLAAATQLYRPRGIQAYRGVSSQELLSLLRTGFNLEEFERDGVFWRLKHWQWRNPRYSLFSDWRKLEPFGILLDHRYFESDLHYLADSGLQVAVLQLDLDHFKSVNDTLGHLEGDDAIRLAERVLLRLVNGRGDCYRRGGDELVSFVVGVTPQEAAEFAERLRSEMETTFAEWAAAHSLTPAPTASIGVVHVRTKCAPPDVLNQLERAQLDAKRSGRNRVVAVQLPVES